MQKAILLAVFLLAGCSNYVAGTVNGEAPFVAKSALFYTWPPRGIDFATVDATTACGLVKQRMSAGGGGLLISPLSGQVGSETVCMDTEARMGRCRGPVVRYFAKDNSHEYDWKGTVTLSSITSESVRGEFDLQSDSGQIRGQFDAKPCLND